MNFLYLLGQWLLVRKQNVEKRKILVHVEYVLCLARSSVSRRGATVFCTWFTRTRLKACASVSRSTRTPASWSTPTVTTNPSSPISTLRYLELRTVKKHFYLHHLLLLKRVINKMLLIAVERLSGKGWIMSSVYL